MSNEIFFNDIANEFLGNLWEYLLSLTVMSIGINICHC